MLAALGSEHFDAILGAAARAENEEIQKPLFGYLSTNAAGNEKKLGDLLSQSDLPRGRALLTILSRIDSDEAREALGAAEMSASPELRVEAVAMRAAASTEGLRDELAALSNDTDPHVRVAALRTMQRYKVKEAGPALVQTIQSAGFAKLPLEERRLALRDPARAVAGTGGERGSRDRREGRHDHKRIGGPDPGDRHRIPGQRVARRGDRGCARQDEHQVVE